MKVSDLVWLNREEFYEFDENVGIILEIINTADGKLIRVAWDDDEIGWYHEL